MSEDIEYRDTDEKERQYVKVAKDRSTPVRVQATGASAPLKDLMWKAYSGCFSFLPDSSCIEAIMAGRMKA